MTAIFRWRAQIGASVRKLLYRERVRERTRIKRIIETWHGMHVSHRTIIKYTYLSRAKNKHEMFAENDLDEFDSIRFDSNVMIRISFSITSESPQWCCEASISPHSKMEHSSRMAIHFGHKIFSSAAHKLDRNSIQQSLVETTYR